MRKFKITLILYVTLISFTLTAQNFNIDPLKYSNKPRYQPYLGQSTNNLHYFGSTFDFEADRVADDFGPRRYTDKYGVVHYYDWHSGVDYNVQSQHGNPTNNNGEGAMIKSISSGQIIDYDQILSAGFKSIGVKNKYCKDVSYTASNNPNCTNTDFRYFYYEHIFESSSKSSVPRDFQGCSLMWIDGSLPKDKKWTVVFKNNGSYSAIGPYAGTVTFNDENGNPQPPVTVKNMIDIDEPLAPLGGSVGYTPHAHIQTMTQAVQNPGGDDVHSKNVIEFVPHEDPNYSIKIRDELTTNPIALSYPGNKTTLIRVMPEMPSTISGNAKRYPTLYNVDKVKVNIKKDFQAVSEYKNLIGKTTLADFCLGARYATTITNMGRKPTDLGSSTKIGMRSNCYSDNNPEKYDEFFFYDFMSAIHKNANYSTKKTWVADNPENALYTDGKYHISAEVQKVNNNVQYSNPEDLYLDNYFPYISSAIIQFSKKTYSKTYLGDYAVFWKPFESKETIYGDGYVSYAATNKCKPKEDLEESVLGDIVVFATTKEPLNDLKLKVNGIGANLISRDYLNKFDATNNTFEAKFKIKGYGSSLKTIGKIALEFAGEDVYKNPLLDVAKYHKNYSFMVPKRKDYGYTVADKCEDKCWTPKPIFGKDDFHIFDLGACKPVAIVNDCIENSQIEVKITRSISTGGSISLTVGGVNPNTLGLGLKIAWKKGDEDLPQFNNLFSITGLSEGFYCYQITCECCTFGDCIEVPSCPLLLQTFSKTLETCPNGTNATIGITAGNGTAPYAYQWSNGKNTSFISDLGVGTYTVTITDSEGCKSVHPFTIEEAIEITATVTNICSATELGSIVLDVKDNRQTHALGGNPIGFSWEKLNAGTWEAFSAEQNLVDLTDAGKFKLYYDDGICFQLIGEYEVKKSDFKLSYSVSPETVKGAKDGNLSFTVSGLAIPTTYSITGIANGADITGTITSVNETKEFFNLGAGIYTLTVIDANQCSKIVQIEVYECNSTTAFDVKEKITPISIAGAADGKIELNFLAQFNSTLKYEWTGPGNFIATTQNINNLAMIGNYCVKITDSKCNKIVTKCYKIEKGAGTCTFTFKKTVKSDCSGQPKPSGSFAISPISGIAPYTYTWSSNNAILQTGANNALNNIGVGTYKVVATDMAGCNVEEQATINSNLPIVIVSDEICSNATGSIALKAKYGTNLTCSDCTFTWSDGYIGATRNLNQPFSNYSVTVSNPVGCEQKVEPKLVVISKPKVTNFSCTDSPKGKISFSVYSKTETYSYYFAKPWGEPLGSALGNSVTIPIATTKNIEVNDLKDGDYLLVIKDAKGTCSYEYPFNIKCCPSATNILISQFSIKFANKKNEGAITIDVSPSNANYIYEWSNGSKKKDISGLAKGNYCVYITVKGSCEYATQCFDVLDDCNDVNVGSEVIMPCTYGKEVLGSKISIKLIPSPKSLSYSYIWKDGSTLGTRTDLKMNTFYKVTVTSTNDCKIERSYLTAPDGNLTTDYDLKVIDDKNVCIKKLLCEGEVVTPLDFDLGVVSLPTFVKHKDEECKMDVYCGYSTNLKNYKSTITQNLETSYVGTWIKKYLPFGNTVDAAAIMNFEELDPCSRVQYCPIDGSFVKSKWYNKLNAMVDMTYEGNTQFGMCIYKVWCQEGIFLPVLLWNTILPCGLTDKTGLIGPGLSTSTWTTSFPKSCDLDKDGIYDPVDCDNKYGNTSCSDKGSKEALAVDCDQDGILDSKIQPCKQKDTNGCTTSELVQIDLCLEFCDSLPKAPIEPFFNCKDLNNNGVDDKWDVSDKSCFDFKYFPTLVGHTAERLEVIKNREGYNYLVYGLSSDYTDSYNRFYSVKSKFGMYKDFNSESHTFTKQFSDSSFVVGTTFTKYIRGYAPQLGTNKGLYDVGIVRYDIEGNAKWAKLFGSSKREIIKDLTVDAKDNVYMLTEVEDSLMMGEKLLYNNGIPFLNLSKFNSKGEIIWNKNITSSDKNSDMEGFSIKTTQSGNVLLSYQSNKATNVEDSGEISKLNEGQSLNLALLDDSGKTIWNKNFGIAKGVFSNVKIEVYKDEFIVLMNNGGKVIGDKINSSGIEGGYHLLKINTKGEIIWDKVGADNSTANGITIDDQGKIYVIGSFKNTIDFDNKTKLQSNGSADLFIAKYSQESILLGVKSIGTKVPEYPVDIKYVDGKLVCLGNFTGAETTLEGHYVKGFNDVIPNDFLIEVEPFGKGSFIPDTKAIYKIANEQSVLNINKIYPNPTDNLLNIDIASDESQSIQLKVIDLLGREVFYEQKVISKGSQTLKIDCSLLNRSSLYQFVIIDRQGLRQVGAFFLSN